jgi:hypothetical protein
MGRLLFVAAWVALALEVAERWVAFRSGPFEVYSSAGERAGRERLNELEQLRFALEQLLGRAEMKPAWPVRIIVSPTASESEAVPRWSRDAYVAAVAARGPAPRQLLEGCTRLLLDAGPGRLPDDMENALAVLFSTLDAGGRTVMLGAPPPASERNLEWARMHLLATSEAYYGRLRTLVYNLDHGADLDPAYRNAFGKSPADLAREAAEYSRAGSFAPVQVQRKPVDPERDFAPEPVEPPRSQLLRADLWLADPARAGEAEAAYREILKAAPADGGALEGLALAALAAGQRGEALERFRQALAAAELGARAYFEYGRLETDRDQAREAFEKAAKLNPRWGAPYFELAQRESDAALAAGWLKLAAQREPRRLDYWRTLAESQEAAGQFVDAAKSWAAAEVAAGNPSEREQIRRIRAQADERRREQEAAERERKAAEARREIEMLKQKSFASIQAAIDKANRENPPLAPSSGKVEPWWTGPRADGKVQGTLRQVDCLGHQARLIIESGDRQVTRLLIRDPAQVAFAGGGERSLSCGPQKPARRGVVDYYIKPDPKFGTAGDAALIEFP